MHPRQALVNAIVNENLFSFLDSRYRTCIPVLVISDPKKLRDFLSVENLVSSLIMEVQRFDCACYRTKFNHGPEKTDLDLKEKN